MSYVVNIGAVCKTCGEMLQDVMGEPTNCPDCEQAMVSMNENVEEGDEQRDFMVMISGPYLSAACVMVAEQYINRDKMLWPETKEVFVQEATEIMRYHSPIAYAYFFDNGSGDEILPSGTIDIILDFIWRNPLSSTFLGGKHSGIILPGQS